LGAFSESCPKEP